MTADDFDWDGYWDGTVDGGPMDANGSAARLDLLERFIEEVGVPSSFADVGCGEAYAAAAVAESHPGTEVRGYDVSPTVIGRNRERHDLPNLAFSVASLPDPDIDRRFEMVHCYVTLHYVREIERGIEDLYDLVEPGGHLVASHPNGATGRVYGEGIEEGTSLRHRFRLVCEGENLVSRERIGDLLGAPTSDYWERVDAPDEASGPDGCNPCTVVAKPDE